NTTSSERGGPVGDSTYSPSIRRNLRRCRPMFQSLSPLSSAPCSFPGCMNCTKSGITVFPCRPAVFPVDRGVEVGGSTAVVDRVRPRVGLIQFIQVEVQLATRLPRRLGRIVSAGGIEEELDCVSAHARWSDESYRRPCIAEAETHVLRRRIDDALSPRGARLGHERSLVSERSAQSDDDVAMLTEDAVVGAVCRSLEEHGYEIVTRALATEHGHDIVAVKD